FLSSCALVAASLAAESWLGSGCGSSAAPATGGAVKGGNCLSNGASMAVGASGGHTHSGAAVTAADVSAGSGKTYALGTTDAHSHNVTLSAAQLASLKDNQGIAINTDTDSTGHTHSV